MPAGRVGWLLVGALRSNRSRHVLGPEPGQAVLMPIALASLIVPTDEHVRRGPTVRKPRSPFLAVWPDEPNDHRDLAHRALRHRGRHLLIERPPHIGSIEHLFA
jgi:hypothetical protein